VLSRGAVLARGGTTPQDPPACHPLGPTQGPAVAAGTGFAGIPLAMPAARASKLAIAAGTAFGRLIRGDDPLEPRYGIRSGVTFGDVGDLVPASVGVRFDYTLHRAVHVAHVVAEAFA